MRLLAIVFVTLLLLIQYPLWLGKGGWLRVWELDQQVSQAQMKNEGLKERNNKLASEVEDLKLGTGAVEERARFELGMIKKDEIFVQILNAGTEIKSNPASASASGNKPRVSGGH
jgi:cell division protein FtsB